MALIGTLLRDPDKNVRRPCPWSLTPQCDEASAVKIGYDVFADVHRGCGARKVECYECTGCGGIYHSGSY